MRSRPGSANARFTFGKRCIIGRRLSVFSVAPVFESLLTRENMAALLVAAESWRCNSVQETRFTR